MSATGNEYPTLAQLKEYGEALKNELVILPNNVVYQTDGMMQSPNGTNLTAVSVSDQTGNDAALQLSTLLLNHQRTTAPVGQVSFSIEVEDDGTTLSGNRGMVLEVNEGKVDVADLVKALKTIASLESEVDSLKSQLAAKANAADVYTKTAADGKFALKTDIPDVSGFITKTAADAAYQAKGSYATTSTVTALTTRVSTAEGEIDTLQTGLAAATAAGTTQLTVADLTAAKTNTKNLVTA